MKDDALLSFVNEIREDAGLDLIRQLNDKDSLRSDLGFDSLELAVLAVKIEAKFGIDVFDQGLVDKISDIRERLDDR